MHAASMASMNDQLITDARLIKQKCDSECATIASNECRKDVVDGVLNNPEIFDSANDPDTIDNVENHVTCRLSPELQAENVTLQEQQQVAKEFETNDCENGARNSSNVAESGDMCISKHLESSSDSIPVALCQWQSSGVNSLQLNCDEIESHCSSLQAGCTVESSRVTVSCGADNCSSQPESEDTSCMTQVSDEIKTGFEGKTDDTRSSSLSLFANETDFIPAINDIATLHNSTGFEESHAGDSPSKGAGNVILYSNLCKTSDNHTPKEIVIGKDHNLIGQESNSRVIDDTSGSQQDAISSVSRVEHEVIAKQCGPTGSEPVAVCPSEALPIESVSTCHSVTIREMTECSRSEAEGTETEKREELNTCSEIGDLEMTDGDASCPVVNSGTVFSEKQVIELCSSQAEENCDSCVENLLNLSQKVDTLHDNSDIAMVNVNSVHSNSNLSISRATASGLSIESQTDLHNQTDNNCTDRLSPSYSTASNLHENGMDSVISLPQKSDNQGQITLLDNDLNPQCNNHLLSPSVMSVEATKESPPLQTEKLLALAREPSSADRISVLPETMCANGEISNPNNKEDALVSSATTLTQDQSVVTAIVQLEQCRAGLGVIAPLPCAALSQDQNLVLPGKSKRQKQSTEKRNRIRKSSVVVIGDAKCANESNSSDGSKQGNIDLAGVVLDEMAKETDRKVSRVNKKIKKSVEDGNIASLIETPSMPARRRKRGETVKRKTRNKLGDQAIEASVLNSCVEQDYSDFLRTLKELAARQDAQRVKENSRRKLEEKECRNAKAKAPKLPRGRKKKKVPTATLR